MSWRIIYASEVDKLSLHLHSLKVKKGDLEIKIPLSDIFAVVVEDLTANLTTRLLVELSRNNILVILCNQQHLPECIIQPVSGHFGQYKQMVKQLSWEEDLKGTAWQSIIRYKIKNQIECMKKIGTSNHRLDKMVELGKNITINDQTNIEGQAARIYFNSIFDGDFVRSNPNLVENAALNYGYAIFNAAIARTIVAKGLIPALGIYHKGERNHFNLASDIIEPFRPIVDYFVSSKPPEIFLTKDYRVKLINLLHTKILIDGKQQTVIRAIEIMIQSLFEFFETGGKQQIKMPSLMKIKFYEL
ncbi:type II CRISPR-associated endonuclease Cas1 [Massilibacterium senegalense]|uniref:type II CRISPR-associated endonuclease Cas1 n=1 Tax=Massilibacterium senegalense TaxID=1632858 RepID=UPI000782AEEE|nr:type II CRISPR-associated endonuclease Cas1 [Massilibacterium senegalense]